MIKLYDNGALRTFPDVRAIIGYFGLTVGYNHHETMAGIRAASDAGFPLHACIDPCTAEIHGRNVLMVDNDAASLRADYAQRLRDI